MGCMEKQLPTNVKQSLKIKPIKNITSYAVYYGRDKIDKLSGYDLVILEPDNYSKDEIQKLKENGTIIVAYLSIGEVSASRSYFSEVRECIIGKNPTWNSYYVNVSCKRWQDIILNEIIPKILSKGFDGVFLDTIDVVDLYPNMKRDMIELIASIRKNYPDIVIIQNRGFSIIDETVKYINGILFECFTTRYNWKSKTYEVWSSKDLNWIDNIAEKLVKLRKKYGIIVLTLDYAENESLKRFCIRHAEKFGFIPFVSTINLMTLSNN